MIFFTKRSQREYVIIEALRCLLSLKLSEEFKGDKHITKARAKYIRSTINLLDEVNDWTREQFAGVSKKVETPTLKIHIKDGRIYSGDGQ